MSSRIKIAVAVVIVLAVAFAAFRVGVPQRIVGGISDLLPKGVADAKSSTGTPQEAIAGKRACGVSLGDSPLQVMRTLGKPEDVQSYSAFHRWFWGVARDRQGNVLDYKVFVGFQPFYGKGWKAVGIQCFRPSTSGTIQTGRSTQADVIAVYGEPEEILFWERDGDPTSSTILVYEKIGWAVTVGKDGIVNGFIVLEAPGKN